MRGSEFVDALPEAPGPRREAAILDAVRAGSFVLDWSPIEVRDDRHAYAGGVPAGRISSSWPAMLGLGSPDQLSLRR